jgi:hypothetical protein
MIADTYASVPLDYLWSHVVVSRAALFGYRRSIARVVIGVRGFTLMLGWFAKRRAQREEDLAQARALIAIHGDQARHVLIAQIRDEEGRGVDCKRAWAVFRHVRKLSGHDGLDSATRRIEAP